MLNVKSQALGLRNDILGKMNLENLKLKSTLTTTTKPNEKKTKKDVVASTLGKLVNDKFNLENLTFSVATNRNTNKKDIF